MGSAVNEYLLVDELSTINAGTCQWGFARKDRHEYFIKQFLTPKYPLDEGKLGPELTKKMQESAECFFYRKKAFYSRLAQCRTGNNMIVIDFFRSGTAYYAVTDKVEGPMLTVAQVAKLGDDQKYTLTRSILYSVSRLHNKGIVHSDFRPENVLIKETRGGYCTAKIIDFDAGFLETEAPDNIEGSLDYFSPEAVRRIHGESEAITVKSDIWALGLLLHQYWSGKMPAFSADYRYVSEAVLNDGELCLALSIPEDIRLLIGRMLSKNPGDRPGAEEAWKCVRKTTAAVTEALAKENLWTVPDELG